MRDNESDAGFQKNHGETIESYGHVIRRDEEHILRKELRMDIPGENVMERRLPTRHVSNGLRAREETDWASWSRKIISHIGYPR